MNDITVLRELDIFGLTKEKFLSIDFVILFEIMENGRALSVVGHPVSEIVTGEMELSFCLGECSGPEDKSFVVSAFSVIKFLASKLPPVDTLKARGIQLDDRDYSGECKEGGKNVNLNIS